MAVFNYKVVDRDGKNKKGTIEAPNRDGAEKKLKSEGYSIMSLTEQSSPLGGIGFKTRSSQETWVYSVNSSQRSSRPVLPSYPHWS